MIYVLYLEYKIEIFNKSNHYALLSLVLTHFLSMNHSIFCSEPNLTLVFVDGNERVFAQDLTRHSKYFKREVEDILLLEGNEEALIDLQESGETKSEFQQFLKCFKPGKPVVNDINVIYLSKSAKKFEVDFIKELCEDWLVSHPSRINEISFLNEIKLAKDNNFRNIIKSVLIL